MFETHLSWWEMVLRLVLALNFGAAIGWEREAKHRPAGLRTHMLVALGSAGLTLVAMELLSNLNERAGPYPYDAVRIIAAVVGGIGFLGAGAIIQSRGEVIGLTTAASLWVVAAMGIAFGCGYYLLGLLLSAFALITLKGMKLVQRKYLPSARNLWPPKTDESDEPDEPKPPAE